MPTRYAGRWARWRGLGLGHQLSVTPVAGSLFSMAWAGISGEPAWDPPPLHPLFKLGRLLSETGNFFAWHFECLPSCRRDAGEAKPSNLSQMAFSIKPQSDYTSFCHSRGGREHGFLPKRRSGAHPGGSWTGSKMGRAPAQLIAWESEEEMLQIAGLRGGAKCFHGSWKCGDEWGPRQLRTIEASEAKGILD